jgi:DNA-directed RNA polymerase specialized sigma24 family protein
MTAVTLPAVAPMEDAAHQTTLDAQPEPARRLDEESRSWLRDLRAEGATKDEAIVRLHQLLLRAARFEVSRRATLPHLRGSDLDDLANQAADDALMTLQRAIGEILTPHQRRVLVALALNEVPIDVLAESLQTTRGALYKTLHDARRKLRKHLEECGLSLDAWLGETN